MFWGKLASINLYNCDHNLIQDKRYIKKYILEVCKVIDMKRFGKPIIKKLGSGSLEGVSAFQFIETSSITMHFDDKIKNRAFIDIFSCKDFDEKKAEEFSKSFFGAEKSISKVMIRD
ncbi:MAG: S-adenosylmethionine decarboxylase [Candidatus Pacearchaeota archaeon]|nr:S-adenosylmethionine decarboxylase [Candidatus Pacearchaeota archaeon]MDE1848489.1 S-adenosylmethionine decarboxylase [Nanoarchaeota archaeon]